MAANDATRQIIDWEMRQTGDPHYPSSFVYMVDIGPPPVFRGRTSAHDCVGNAIRDAISENARKALGWLKAGVNHDQGAMDELDRAGGDALAYAIDTYRRLFNL